MSDWTIQESPDSIGQSICCPICGVRLDEIVLACPDDEYFCPFCCTRQKPGGARSAPSGDFE